MSAGGDQLDYPSNPNLPAVSVIDSKIHINSTISYAHKGYWYMGLDIGNFYFVTPIAYLQYIRGYTSFIPQEVMDQYKFTVKADSYVYY